MHFEFAYFYFVPIHLELKRKIRSYTPVFPRNPIVALVNLLQNFRRAFSPYP